MTLKIKNEFLKIIKELERDNHINVTWQGQMAGTILIQNIKIVGWIEANKNLKVAIKKEEDKVEDCLNRKLVSHS